MKNFLVEINGHYFSTKLILQGNFFGACSRPMLKKWHALFVVFILARKGGKELHSVRRWPGCNPRHERWRSTWSMSIGPLSADAKSGTDMTETGFLEFCSISAQFTYESSRFQNAKISVWNPQSGHATQPATFHCKFLKRKIMADREYLHRLSVKTNGGRTSEESGSEDGDPTRVRQQAPEVRSEKSEEKQVAAESIHLNAVYPSSLPGIRSGSEQDSGLEKEKRNVEKPERKKAKSKKPGATIAGLFQKLTGSKPSTASTERTRNETSGFDHRPSRRTDSVGKAIHAIEKGLLDDLMRLVPSEVPVNSLSAQGHLLLSIARFHKQEDMVAYLLRQYTGRVIKAIENGDIREVRAFVPEPIEADAVSTKGRGLLEIAAFHHQPEIGAYLKSCMNMNVSPTLAEVVLPKIELPNASSRKMIEFYQKDAPFYQFTNFHAGNPILIDGKFWRTSEHYFQAQKFTGDAIELQDHVRDLPTARAVFEYARANDGKKRNDWPSVKEDVMRKALRAKFTQDDALKDLLLQTGNAKLVENSPTDSYWGCGKNGDGKNRLGELLMELRSELRAELRRTDD